MNRFSQEVPPKTAWTIVAGLVVVFIMVFSLASNSDGNSDSMLGAVIQGFSGAVKAVTTPIKEALIPGEAPISSSKITNTASYTRCIADEAAEMRGQSVVASNDRASMPRATHTDNGDVGTTIQAQTKVHASIEAAIRAVGATPIEKLSCIVTGYTVNATAAQLLTLGTQGYAVTDFGAVSGQ